MPSSRSAVVLRSLNCFVSWLGIGPAVSVSLYWLSLRPGLWAEFSLHIFLNSLLWVATMFSSFSVRVEWVEWSGSRGVGGVEWTRSSGVGGVEWMEWSGWSEVDGVKWMEWSEWSGVKWSGVDGVKCMERCGAVWSGVDWASKLAEFWLPFTVVSFPEAVVPFGSEAVLSVLATLALVVHLAQNICLEIMLTGPGGSANFANKCRFLSFIGPALPL